MSDNNVIGFRAQPLPKPDAANRVEHVIIQRPLDRVLAFTGRSIHDVINNPLARNQVYSYFKLHCWVQRGCEISELERQWNGTNH